MENDEAETPTGVPLTSEPVDEAAVAEAKASVGAEGGPEDGNASIETVAEVTTVGPVKLVEEIEDSLMPPAEDAAAPSNSGT